jgi:flagellar protein FliO/FliZ
MSGDLIWAVVRLLVALPLVLGMIYLVLKYGFARRYGMTAGNHRMKLVEQLPLGPKTILSLVALGGRYYLLAHQDNSISLVKDLGELPEPEELKVVDIMDLTPRSIEEYDRAQKSGGSGEAGRLFGIPKGGCGLWLKKLAARVVRAKEIIIARVATRLRAFGKGGKKPEG